MNAIDLTVSKWFYLSDLKKKADDESIVVWRKWRISTNAMAGEDYPNAPSIYLSVCNEYRLGNCANIESVKVAHLEREPINGKKIRSSGFTEYTSVKFLYSSEIYIREIEDEILLSTRALYISDGHEQRLIGGIVFGLGLDIGFCSDFHVFELLTPDEFETKLYSAGYDCNSEICLRLNTLHGKILETNPTSLHYKPY